MPAVRALAALTLFGLASLAACRDPSPPDGAITCGAGGTCPEGYYCVVGDVCYKDGHLPPRPDGGITCDEYCLCMAVGCSAANGGFVDEKACFTECKPLESTAPDKLKCRLDHCVYARDGINGAAKDPVTHCPHSRGASPCN